MQQRVLPWRHHNNAFSYTCTCTCLSETARQCFEKECSQTHQWLQRKTRGGAKQASDPLTVAVSSLLALISREYEQLVWHTTGFTCRYMCRYNYTCTCTSMMIVVLWLSELHVHVHVLISSSTTSSPQIHVPATPWVMCQKNPPL